MSKVFTIADLYLGHEKVAIARGFASVDEHDDEIIRRWNTTVRKHDSTFILGAVCFGQRNLWKLGLLHGTKKLVMGNHDKYPIDAYRMYFSQIFGCVQYRNHILSHIPIHESQLERFKGNIHGHLHDKMVTTTVTEFDTDLWAWKTYTDIPDIRYKCVSAEQINLTPIAFEELV